MSDTEEVQLPIPARTTVSSDVAPSEGSRGGGRGGGGGGGGGSSLFLGFGTGLSSRKFGDGGTRRLRTAGSRRQNLASNGSNGRMETEGSVTGGRGGGKGSNGGSKACTACGIQFTWRQRRHHCRACRKACCDACSKERLMIVGGDSKRHRICHPCVKAHLATGRTREHRVVPTPSASVLSSPLDSLSTSRDTSRHGNSSTNSLRALTTYAENPGEPRTGHPAGWVRGVSLGVGGGAGFGEVTARVAAGAGAAQSAAAAAAAATAAMTGAGEAQSAAAAAAAAAAAMAMARAETGAGEVQSAAAAAAAAAAAMAAAWTGNNLSDVRKMHPSTVVEAPFTPVAPESPSSLPSLVATARAIEPSSAPSRSPPVAPSSDAAPSGNGRAQPSLTTSIPAREGTRGRKKSPAGELELDDALAAAPTEESWTTASGKDRKGRGVVQGQGQWNGGETPQRRPPLGTGVRADPASHQHKRPVQSAKDQNPLALPWFTGKHTSPCTKCEDLWRVAWSAREDFLRDLSKAEKGKDYQLVHSAAENLRLYSSGNVFWGGYAIRLRVEAEVAVPIGFAMRWLASLTARGGVYYPYGDTVACDIVEADSGALSVACAHWPTQLSGARRCTMLRYVSEDGSPPPGMEEEAAAAAARNATRDVRPTIVFATIDHPIMREWALPGVDVEVFPSGLALEEMDSSAGPVTKVKALLGWDNKGTLQHMTKMSYMAERADRMEGLGQHLRAMERGYQEQSESARGGDDESPLSVTLKLDRGTTSAGTGRRASAGPGRSKAGMRGNGPPTIDSSPLPPTHQQQRRQQQQPHQQMDQLHGRGLQQSAKAVANGVGVAKMVGREREDEDGEEDLDERGGRMTSRAVPLSPNRGRELTGGDDVIEDEEEWEEGDRHAERAIRRMSESGHGSSGHGVGAGSGGGGGSAGDRNSFRGSKKIPSQARAAELEAEVSFLNRKLSARQSLEEKLRIAEADKARLITKLATAKADSARRTEILENMVKDMSEKLAMTHDQMSNTQRRLGDAEQRAMTAQRDLRLSRDALRVQADLSKAASASAAVASRLSLSPGTSARFPTSNHDLPLAASPVLRAPPPISWGSGPILPGGVGGGGDGERQADGEAGKGRIGELINGRTQEMGVRFALDTLRYSDDEEVVVFMLHLVQGLRFEADMLASSPEKLERDGRQRSKSFPGGLSKGLAADNSSSDVVRTLFKSPQRGLASAASSVGVSIRQKGGDEPGSGHLSQLALLLISRACENDEVANFLFWYLKLEAEANAARRSMYERVRTALTENLAKNNAPFASALKAAEAYVSAISEVHATVKRQGGRASKKTARLKNLLTERRLHVVPDPSGGSNNGRRGWRRGTQDIPLPLDPKTLVLGMRPATAYTFPSAMSPCVVEFVLSDSVSPSFKGDDLLLDPSLDEGPGMVTDISSSLMHAWSGGRLPRQRTSSGSVMLLPVTLEEESEDESSDSEYGVDKRKKPGVSPKATADGKGERDEEDYGTDFEDESFLDRRRISADVGSIAELYLSRTDHAVMRKRDMSESALSTSISSAKAVEKLKKEVSGKTRGKNEVVAKEAPHEDKSRNDHDKDRVPLSRRASSDLTKLCLWEQMQVLGAASQERGSYLAIFKNGEDVRQDQLAVHMVSLMDRQLKEAGLDLRLRPYRVLATSLTTGMVEFVPGSVPMSAVLARHNNSVLEFLRHHNADPAGPLSMKREALDNFTRSCAGSCVVTYLLGVGDRHLDNLMLLPEGILFHIDFGYLFGKDPKMMPPPFRLTKEMVEAMGGMDAPHYTVFKSLCCQAYRHLRKSAHQYLNLLSLMAGAGIKDLADDPPAVLQLVQDRFKLDLTDEAADAHFLGLVSQSVTAIAPRVMEVMHQIRVAAR